MKILSYIMVVTAPFFMSCTDKTSNKNTDHHHAHEDTNTVTLTEQQITALDLKIGALALKNLSDFVKVTGKIEVPPNEKVTINAIVGVNIADIKVLEGAKVKKGTVIATLEHPNLTEMQIQYKTRLNRLNYLEKEYKRLKILSANNIASGKAFQKAEMEYLSAKTILAGLKQKLDMIGVNASVLEKREPLRYVDVKVPIDGIVSKVQVNKGQFVEPHQKMFEVINYEHVHADLRVYEKDLPKIKKNQKVILTLGSAADNSYDAEVIAVGHSLDEKTRSVLVQAEIPQPAGELIPGIFIDARILVKNKKVYALPEDAVVSKGDRTYIFMVDSGEHEKKHGHDREEEHATSHNEAHDHKEDEHKHRERSSLVFKRIEVITGAKDRNYVEVKPLEKIPEDAHFALNGAYFLFAEMKKNETTHTH